MQYIFAAIALIAFIHIPEQFFTITIKEPPDENFGIGGKSISEIKRAYRP